MGRPSQDALAAESSARLPPRRRWHFSAGPVIGAFLVLFVLALLALFGVSLSRREGRAFGGFGINAVGRAVEITARPASEFSVESLTGGSLRLADHRGRVVILNFWASWCPPCREEAPILASVAEAYAGRGITFAGLNLWDSESDARSFVDRYGIRYPNGLDRDGRVAIDFGVTGIPETYAISPDGTLLRKWIGPFTRQQLERFVEESLG